MLAAEPLTDSERLRIVYLLITSPASEGGAGITPRKGEWANVQSIFPLHDHSFNKEWLKHWSGKMYISTKDLTQIRDRFGEKVGMPEPPFTTTRLTFRRRLPSTLRSFKPMLSFSFSPQSSAQSLAIACHSSPLYTRLPLASGLQCLLNIGSARRLTSPFAGVCGKCRQFSTQDQSSNMKRRYLTK